MQNGLRELRESRVERQRFLMLLAARQHHQTRGLKARHDLSQVLCVHPIRKCPTDGVFERIFVPENYIEAAYSAR